MLPKTPAGWLLLGAFAFFALVEVLWLA